MAALAVTLGTLVSAVPAWPRQWTEDDFQQKRTAAHFMIVAGQNWRSSQSVIGSTQFYQVQKGDTFLDIARYYGLGYNELEDANPGVDVWVPPAGQVMLLPTEYIIPDAEAHGIVVNIPEMRLYYFHPRPNAYAPMMVTTYPVGLGRDEWKTPLGAFRVADKTVNPMWILPESIREEHMKDGRPAPKFIPGGDPENPLGKYRLKLQPLGRAAGDYGIHGTNIPWGVGMQVSHGCIRLYPEDIEQLFPLIPVREAVQFVYQPVKVGSRDGEIYVEVHKDIYQMTPGPYREAQRLLQKYGWTDRVDDHRLRRAITEQSGVPMLISREASNDGLVEERFRSRRSSEPPKPQEPPTAKSTDRR
ncbi:MAG TPA: L,D-transpeptidase family protein [Candidatus Binatia bacterium]|nr:L,D-transpeptidase family protein [Candidatus Binatia bacterium]